MKLKRIVSILLAVFVVIPTFSFFSSFSSHAMNPISSDEAIAWVKSKVGQTVEFFDYSNYAQCVDLIAAYYNYLGVDIRYESGEGYSWNSYPDGWNRFKDAQPQKGDILVYTGGSGHVAIYESDYSHYHQNFNGNSYVERVTYKYNELHSNYWGVIHPNFKNTTSLTDYSGRDEIRYTIKDNVPARPAPYKKSGLKKSVAKKNTPVTIVGAAHNTVGNLWYKLDDDSWIWSENLSAEAQYIVRFNANGGAKSPKAQTKKQGKNLTLSSAVPIRKGYKFVGWSTDKNAKAASYQPGATYKKDKSTTLYAIWEKTSVVVTPEKYRIDLCHCSNTALRKTSENVSVDLKKSSPLSLLDLGTIKLRVRSNADHIAPSISKVNDKKYTLKISLNDVTKIKSGMVYIDALDTENDMNVLTTVSIYTKVNKLSSVFLFGADGKAINISYKNYGEPFTIPDIVPKSAGKTFIGWSKTKDATSAEFGPGDLYKTDADISLYPVFITDYGVKYSFDEKTGVLTVFGYGDMACYTPSLPAPWAKYSSKATKLVVQTNPSNWNEEVKTIGSHAFRNFTKLKEVVLTPRIRSIGAYAFYGCSSLTNLVLYEGTSIGNNAFAKCYALNSFAYNSGNSKKSARVADTGNNLGTAIGAQAFADCTNLQSVEIPSSITDIGESAFEGCTGLQSVTIDANTDRLNDTVFFNCENLKEVDFPDQVTAIGDGTFNGCSSLQSVDIPETVTEIGDQSFSGCSALTAVEIPESVEVIGSSAFSNCTALSSVTLPDSMDYLGDGMFAGCSALTSIDLPEGLANLGDGTFQNCTSLISVEFPSTMSEVGDSAFAGCSSLQSIVIPDNISTIKDFAFSNCSVLNSVDLSDNLGTIGSGAFSYCTALETISLPGSLSDIQTGAFLGCTALQTVNFETDVDLSIGDEAFSGCTALADVVLPASVVAIGDNVFSNCSSDLNVQCYSTSAAYDDIVAKTTNSSTIVPVESIAFENESCSLKKDETLKLIPIIQPANATDQTVFWYSSNDEVATVSETGDVTVHGTGTAIISAVTQDGDNYAECAVDCTVPVTGVSFMNNSAAVQVGDIISPLYAVYPSNASEIEAFISSSDESVASVEDGLVKVLSKGTAVLTVTTLDGAYTDSYRINATEESPVELPTVKSVSVSDLNMVYKASALLNPEISADEGITCTVSYSTSDPTVATVHPDGRVYAAKRGSATITCTVTDQFGNTVQDTCTVTVQYTAWQWIIIVLLFGWIWY